MDELSNSSENVQALYSDMQWLLEKVEENVRLEKRFEEVDIAIQGLKNAFTPYEKDRFDIKYTHAGIVNGAVRAIKYIRDLNP